MTLVYDARKRSSPAGNSVQSADFECPATLAAKGSGIQIDIAPIAGPNSL